MKKISGTLSAKSIQKMIEELEAYQDILTYKNKVFVRLLLERGIRVAEESIAGGTHTMPNRISFYREMEEDEGVKGILVGVGETFFSHWYEADGTEHHDEVYPLAMMEFGSAGFAVPPTEAYGGSGGRGTFSVSGHESDYSWWIITGYDEEGKPIKKLGTAIQPTRPMYNAVIAMQEDIRECAIEAFGGD